MCVSATWLLSADKNSWWANVEKLFTYKLVQLRIQWLLSPSQPNSCIHKLQAMDGQQHTDTNEEPPPTYMNIALIELREVRVGAGMPWSLPALICAGIVLYATRFHSKIEISWYVASYIKRSFIFSFICCGKLFNCYWRTRFFFKCFVCMLVLNLWYWEVASVLQYFLECPFLISNSTSFVVFFPIFSFHLYSSGRFGARRNNDFRFS
jgi:hypothetical protein